MADSVNKQKESLRQHTPYMDLRQLIQLAMTGNLFLGNMSCKILNYKEIFLSIFILYNDLFIILYIENNSLMTGV